MRPPKPPFQHPPEVYRAIVQEHRSDALRLAESLLDCDWNLEDAAWAAMHWDLPTLAAAVAHERVKRGARPTSLSDEDLARLRAENDAAQKPSATQSRKTTRVVRTTPGRPPQSPKRAEEPGA